MIGAKCKISRRLGTNIFPKCEKSFARRPYAPGPKKKRRPSPLSEYGRELREKQKLKYLYNLGENQFRNYVKDVLSQKAKAEDAPKSFIQILESRLDNVVFRAGFAKTRQQARQLVSHGHFMVDGRKTTVPSYHLGVDQEVSIRPQSGNKGVFRDLNTSLKKFNSPSWIELDRTNLRAKVVALPSLEEAMPPVELSSIFEFYSR